MPREIPILEESDYCTDGEGWTEVRQNTSNVEPMNVTAPAVGDDRYVKRSPFAASNNVRRRAPRAAAVSIKANVEGITYADIIKQER